MRAKVKLEIQDESGNILSELAPYWMELGSQSLDGIEGAVENWRREVLPEIEADLLQSAQRQFTQEAKKTMI